MEKQNMYPNINQPQFSPNAPPAYGQPMAQQPQAVIVQQAVPSHPFGPHPQMATCSNCGERNTTRVEFENGNKTHIAALLMCLVGLWCCCCIPYCVDSLKNCNHYCAKCGNYLGVYSK